MTTTTTSRPPEAATTRAPRIVRRPTPRPKRTGNVDDYDWPETCDTETGRVKIPIANAPPCVAPWEGTDNGGETSPGVTADEIIVAVYQEQPDPLQQLLVEDAGADTDPESVQQAQLDYLTMYEAIAETYGRTLRVETIVATGGPTDATAAQADAQKVIDMGAFAAIDGPGQTPAWYQELVAAEIICMCGATESQATIEQYAPYLWPLGSTPEQADAHFLELVGKQFVGKNAEYAGDPALQSQERVFGWVQAETELDEYKDRNDAFDAGLEEEYGAEIATRFTYLFDTGQRGHDRDERDRADERSGCHVGPDEHRSADPGADHPGSDEAELLPGVDPRAVRVRRHDDLRPNVRPATVVAHARPGAAAGPHGA